RQTALESNMNESIMQRHAVIKTISTGGVGVVFQSLFSNKSEGIETRAVRKIFCQQSVGFGVCRRSNHVFFFEQQTLHRGEHERIKNRYQRGTGDAEDNYAQQPQELSVY